MHSLLLTTPTQYDYDNPVVETNERTIRDWVDQLPLLNLSESIDALFNAIKPLNEQNVNEKVRIRLLEVYRDPVLRIAHTFELNALRHLPISPDERKRLIDDITFLLQELANGYKILVKQGFGKQRSPIKDQNFLLAIYRAIECLSEAVTHNYQIYNSPPAFAYLEIHQLFQYAERNRAVETVIRPCNNSILNLYNQLLLLAIADPYRMPEGEARAAYEFLGQYTPICLLSPQPPVAEEDIGIFTVDLSSDSPPVPVTRNKVYKRDPDFRVLDVRPVLATMLQQVKKITKPSQTMTLQEKILSRLVPNLTAVQLRSEPRIKQRRKVNVALGFAAIYCCLSGKAVRENPVTDAGIEVITLESGESSEPSVLNLEPWIIANESKRGYLLYQPSEMEAPLSIGELVGIENEKQDDPSIIALTLAVVRWMRLQVENQNQMGVEILTTNAHCGRIFPDAASLSPLPGLRDISTSCTSSQGFNCFFWKKNNTDLLLAPPLAWPKTVVLALPNQRREIQLEDTLGDSRFYRLYRYRDN